MLVLSMTLVVSTALVVGLVTVVGGGDGVESALVVPVPDTGLCGIISIERSREGSLLHVGVGDDMDVCEERESRTRLNKRVGHTNP